MPGTAAGTVVRSARIVHVGHLLDARLHGAVLPREDHVRLQEHALEHDVLRRELVEDCAERPPRSPRSRARSCDRRP